MPKIYFDYDSIDTKVIDKLNKAQSYYSKAKNSINYRIPRDCAYLNYLKKLDFLVSDLNSRSSKIKTSLQKTNNKYENSIDNYSDEVSNIEIIEF